GLRQPGFIDTAAVIPAAPLAFQPCQVRLRRARRKRQPAPHRPYRLHCLHGRLPCWTVSSLATPTAPALVKTREAMLRCAHALRRALPAPGLVPARGVPVGTARRRPGRCHAGGVSRWALRTAGGAGHAA